MSKSAIVLSIVSPDPGNPVSLTTLCGGLLSAGGLFKGDTTMDAANSGANYLKATLAGAGDVPIAAGDYHEWSAVNADTVLFLMANGTDKINIVGEAVDPYRPNG